MSIIIIIRAKGWARFATLSRLSSASPPTTHTHTYTHTRLFLPPPPTTKKRLGAPPELRRGALEIRPKRGLELPVEVWRASGPGSVGLDLPRDLSQGMLRSYLAPYEHLPVWHFKSPLRVLRAFDSPQQAAAFRRRVEHLRPLS